MEFCEIISVLAAAILPSLLVGALIYHFGHPLENALMVVALMIFLSLVVLWLVTRYTRAKGDDQLLSIAIAAPDRIEEIPAKSTVSLETPIFTPIHSKLTTIPATAKSVAHVLTPSTDRHSESAWYPDQEPVVYEDDMKTKLIP